MTKGGRQVGAGDVGVDAHNSEADGGGQRCAGHDESK